MALSGASAVVSGAGNLVTIASSTSGIPTPVFADMCIASVASIPITSSICSDTLSGSAAGKSTLFSTGTIS